MPTGLMCSSLVLAPPASWYVSSLGIESWQLTSFERQAADVLSRYVVPHGLKVRIIDKRGAKLDNGA